MDKRLIELRFSKASTSYDENAIAQKMIAQKMIELMIENIPAPVNSIFEFGCGTGIFTELLVKHYNPSRLILNDLCSDMESFFENIPHTQFITGDAEYILPDDKTDIITSCSAIQWFQHPTEYLLRIQSYLSEDGYLAFSTFGKNNMVEIKNITQQGLNYNSLEEIRGALKDSYDIIYAQEDILPLYFSNPLGILYHLKFTGVNATENQHFGPSKLKDFISAYEKFKTDQGYRLTYNPIYIIAKNK